MEQSRSKATEVALQELLDKYNVKVDQPLSLSTFSQPGDSLQLLPGWHLLASLPKTNQQPLLTWRVNRAFTELRKIIADSVVENACLFRFSCLASPDQWSVDALIYREIDLCEFISGGKTMSVFAVREKQSINIILRLDTGVLCSIEISTQLPAGSPFQERHELIGQRGTASDRVVDTQVSQYSIYGYTRNGIEQYKDTDMELFGFDENQIEHVRSAFELLKTPVLIRQWADQHLHLVNLVNAVHTSASERRKVIIA
ncbi:hypothetical protein [Dyadobacter sp. CY323]|uniref:hypothetical protein n=1 Tax=Dyadobacter sp. CY323 TaxID=2907302 RepID=UPI001F404A9B|nr:hypothetical protein [Dyadobacter sp. CY323]MCE6989834.1 hypothetical protein [Dyadobacter sp. CY323]